MTKPLPERLREASVKSAAKCMTPCETICKLWECVGDDDACDAISTECDDLGASCYASCLCAILDLVADEIERDYLERPRFEDGTAVQLGDGVDNGCVITACSIAFHANGGGFSIQAEDDVWDHFAPGETLRRPKPKDTLEAIEDDATLDPKAYCCEHYSGDISGWDDSEYEERKILDLLRRQREVLNRDAGGHEASTCENTCPGYGGFTCSECGHKAMGKVSYCPGCGAKVAKR